MFNLDTWLLNRYNISVKCWQECCKLAKLLIFALTGSPENAGKSGVSGVSVNGCFRPIAAIRVHLGNPILSSISWQSWIEYVVKKQTLEIE